MRRSAAFAFLAILVVPAMSGCTDLLDRPEKWRLDVTIGVIVSSSGAGYALDDVASAVDLAARQFDAAEIGARYSVVQETARGDAPAAFDRLVRAGADVVVAGVQPSEAAALAQRANQQKRLLLLATPAQTALNSPFVLQIATDPEAQGGALARLLTREGTPDVAIVRARDGFAQSVADAFDTAYEGDVTQTLTFRTANIQEAESAGRSACDSGATALLLLMQPDEAGWVIRAAHGRCPGKLAIYAGSQARQQDLVTEAGEDAADKPIAAGVMGIEPSGSRTAVFRSLFDAEYSRAPGPFAAEAYDAASYVTLAAFASKGAPRAKPIEADITPAEIQGKLLTVAESPGVKHREMPRAVSAAKTGEDIDWVGLAHDFDFGDDRRPTASSYSLWRVTATGAIQSDETDRV